MLLIYIADKRTQKETHKKPLYYEINIVDSNLKNEIKLILNDV